MPSKKPLIALRLPEEMHARLVQLAAADHRSPANFIEHTLRSVLDTRLDPVVGEGPERFPRQVHLEEAIAKTKRPRASATKHRAAKHR